MKKNYNTTLHTIPVDLDLGCPNRDENNNGGCSFCPQDGARAAQILDAKDVETQIKNAIEFSQKRYKAKEFMLYIQAYTGTFTSVIKQKESYSKLLKLYNFKAISIGTRPDCLNKSTLEYLQELNKQIDVYVDLGVQTLNDKTLKDINRGHDSKQTIKAIRDLKRYGIKIFAHIIVGFKNESRKDWLNTVKIVCKEKVDGIKIHNLHIIKNTALEKEYEKEVFKTFNEYEYAEELIFLIRNIPSNIPIVRTSTDTPTCDLIAPIWNMQKGQFVEFINESMIYSGFKQGDLIEKKELNLTKQNSFELEDGSITIWNKIYKDYYHPKNGAYLQAKKLFLEQSNLKEKLQEKDISLLDIGFGMGINSLMAIKLEKKFKLDITALDKNKVIIKHSESLNKNKEEKEILKSLYENYEYKNSNNHIKLLIGDARFTITKLDKKFDIVFLDPFLPNLNPSLLSFDFIMLIKKVLKKSGIIICSQNNELIRNAFAKVDFTYKEFELEKTDIKGLILTLGNSFFQENYFQDPYLIFREKQIITNFEQNK
jgi:radical SAM protein (TIGR01212 family)